VIVFLHRGQLLCPLCFCQLTMQFLWNRSWPHDRTTRLLFCYLLSVVIIDFIKAFLVLTSALVYFEILFTSSFSLSWQIWQSSRFFSSWIFLQIRQSSHFYTSKISLRVLIIMGSWIDVCKSVKSTSLEMLFI